MSTPRAPTGATVSTDTNCPRTTFAKVTVSQKVALNKVSVSSSPQCFYRSLAAPLEVYKEESAVVFISPFLPPSHAVSSLQMWMNVRSPESASTAAVSIWTAPTNAPVTMVTKSPQTAKPVKVCKGLCGAVGRNSSLHTSQLVELSRQQYNVCKLFLFVRCQRVRDW